jgi:DNA-binding SARP family transcriptional activator
MAQGLSLGLGCQPTARLTPWVFSLFSGELSNHMTRLAIRMLGPFEVTLNGELVARFETQKARALLAYLAAEGNGPHRREALAEMLWPDRREGAARANLRHALRSLRLAIGDYEARPPFLQATQETIHINPAGDTWVDVAAFSALLPPHPPAGLPADWPSIRQLEEAVQLYRGPFLEDVSLADSAAFEEWRVLQREHFSHLALDALSRLAESYEWRGEYEQALAHARRLVELEPWDESAQQQVMRLLAFTGRRTEALAQYGACRRVLAEELNVGPATETTRLYELIRNGELELPTVAPALLEELKPAPRLPGFLEQETGAV